MKNNMKQMKNSDDFKRDLKPDYISNNSYTRKVYLHTRVNELPTNNLNK